MYILLIIAKVLPGCWSAHHSRFIMQVCDI